MIRRASIHFGLGLLFGMTGSVNSVHAEDEAMQHAGRRRPGASSPAREMAKLRRLHAQMPRELDLDEEQIEIVAEIFDEHFEKLKSAQSEQREARRQNTDRIRQLIQELKEARQSGDDQLAADLRSQIADLRGGGDGDESQHTELFDEIRAELDDVQVEKFDRMIVRLDQPIRQSNRFDGIQRIRRAAESLDLEPDQRQDMRELFIKMQRDAREAGNDAEALQRVEDSSIEAVLDLLYDDQIDPFEERLEALQEREEQPAIKRGPHPDIGVTPAERIEAIETAPDVSADGDVDD